MAETNTGFEKQISAAAHSPEIGKVIDDAMSNIEKENKQLKDILPKNFAARNWTSGDWVMLSICLPSFSRLPGHARQAGKLCRPV